MNPDAMSEIDEINWWSKTIPTEGCWYWAASLSTDGYGRLHIRGRLRQAHRLAYTRFVGEIHEGREIDHLCRNRGCVNPSHLEAVAHKTNVMRGENAVAVYARRTHCKDGHPLSGDNLDISYNKHGHVTRRCVICRRIASRERTRAYRARRKFSRGL